MRRSDGVLVVCAAAVLMVLAGSPGTPGTDRRFSLATHLVGLTSGGDPTPGAFSAARKQSASTKTARRVSPASGAEPAADATAEPAAESGGEKTLSTRIVAYQIAAKLDPSHHSIAGSESLTYRNLTGQPQQTFPFHLYLNAFQPQSTWMTEVHLYGTRGQSAGDSWDPKHFGSITVSKFEVEGAGDLTKEMKFIHPDDENTSDRTVFQVTLPKPVAPGASVTFHIAFEDVMPEVMERTGYYRDFYMVGQWFPKVGVWWKGAWNCHQFHANTEFFSDFGTYDVKVTVPKNEIGTAPKRLNTSPPTSTIFPGLPARTSSRSKTRGPAAPAR
jgi:hypothetical protein